MKKLLLSILLITGFVSSSHLFGQATEKYYIRRTPPEPWTWAPILNTNITEMDDVFGAGGWISGYFTTVVPADVFDDGTCFVFLEGGDDHAIELNAFFTANEALIENWVSNGGGLFICSAPNEGGDMNWGFGGVTLSYDLWSTTVNAVDPAHPIFNGPHVPTGLNWTGNFFNHAWIDAGPVAVNPLIEDSFTGQPVCSELTYGSGKVIFGGMTVTAWHDPHPECVNLRENIFEYLSAYVFLDFTYPDSVYCPYDVDPAPVFAVGADTGVFMATPAGLVIDSITGIIDLDASTPGTYDVSNVMAGASCASGSATFTLTIDAPPVADAGPDLFVCRGDTVQLDGSGGTTYAWSPPAYLDDPTLEDPSVNAPLTNETYQLIVTDALGCSDTDDVNVTLYPDPVIDAGPDQVMVLGGFADLNATGGVTYTWTPAATLSNPLISNPTAYPEDTTTYVVVATDANGCIGTDSVTVFVIDEADIISPNAFTPNGDGVNDTYKPIFIGMGEITDFHIYNRWGAEIFSTMDPAIGWDGYYQGKEQEVGTYVVVIKGLNQFQDVVVKTSTLALLR